MTPRQVLEHALHGVEAAAAPIALYALRFTMGREWALVGTIVVSAIVLGLQWWRSGQVRPLAVIASAVAVVLGALGVVLDSDRYLALEPAIHNALAAGAIIASCVIGRPLLLEIARARIDAEQLERARGFATAATWALAVLCGVRAVVYAVIATHGSLANVLVFRLVLGPATMVLFVGGVALARQLRRTSKNVGPP